MIKPILFSTEMVRAILEGRKTVTRRDPFQTPPDYDVLKGHYRDSKGRLCAVFQCRKDLTTEAVYARYDRGDILWVRETWSRLETGPYLYKADNEKPISYLGWRPSIHMPREAARIFLRVTGVRVEKLRDMVLGDVLVEGITEADTYESTWERWHQTWNSTIKPADHERYGWQANPWVWIIQFERCEKPEGWPG
jgi:hypothetical protein